MNDSVSKFVLTGIIENNSSVPFEFLVNQGPILSVILQYLSLKEIASLRKALMACRATHSVSEEILKDYKLQIIPYPTSLIGSLSSILPCVHTNIREFNVFSDDQPIHERIWRRPPREAFQVFQLISYQHTGKSPKRPTMFERKYGDMVRHTPYLSERFIAAGKLNESTVFYLDIFDDKVLEPDGVVVYAPSYRGLIDRLVHLNLMDKLVGAINASPEVSNALKSHSPSDAGDFLDNIS